MTDRALPTGAAAVIAVAAALAWAGSAAAHDAHCHGVTVVVDSGQGAPAVGCADDPASGIEALAQAGFTVTEVTSFPGAVCRIDDHPETECGPMPPADASWSYWYADTGDDEWTYASVGAGVRDPDEGDLEGWAFGNGSGAPGLAPDEAAAAEPRPEADLESSSPPTWVLAVVILAAIGALVIWRARRDRRA
ncbi:hypothetical protein L0U85_01485 [Glycomyces sp. L485]|uniref:hypothetical protein n=1 Tax=Glycomyces sp. L485 TaxID=2909235 RepID=UPI001F4A5CAF|nr:hypothetical protein [Glycomyces sp. L485]MCH7229540.1 hypothetical protein [Glycomyces sp. L485]